ncbi:hypothetical protein T439DRAFT_106172 [Meredithblackwellia eburnea MCA 4105]
MLDNTLYARTFGCKHVVLECDHNKFWTSLTLFPADSSSSRPRVGARFSQSKGPSSAFDFEIKVEGCLGIISVEKDIYLVLLESSSLAEVPTNQFLRDDNANDGPVHQLGAEDVNCVSKVAFICLSIGMRFGKVENVMESHPCHGIKKVLENGYFFFSKHQTNDITTHLAAQHHTGTFGRSGHFNPNFTFNAFMLEPLMSFRATLTDTDPNKRRSFDMARFAVPCIQGYYGRKVVSIHLGHRDPYEKGEDSRPRLDGDLIIVSRLSPSRNGSQYLRGLDPLGNAANFIETQMIFSLENRVYSFIAVSGSAPREQTSVSLQRQSSDTSPKSSGRRFSPARMNP